MGGAYYIFIKCVAEHTIYYYYGLPKTGENVKITKRFHPQGIPMYKVKGFNDETVEGDFYENNIQKVCKEEYSLWLVEKHIRKRTRGPGATSLT
jgi:hypothetical protein